ncbi:MAG TPA: DUF4139 domain-containing protein [Bacteroidia bacterium]|nr:DUF4139 domain-containing protein [Bacteroidia bacterium]
MKHLFISFFSLSLLNTFAGVGDNEQRLKVPVESVVVYLDGSEITQSKSVILEAGRNTLVFTGISSRLLSKSVQINAGLDVSILSISDKINYMNMAVETPKIKQLKDSLVMLDDIIDQFNYEKEAYDTEKEMLIQNQALGGKEKAVAIAELKLAADFYRSRIKEINGELFKLNKKIEHNNEILNRVNNELTELNAKVNPPMAEITVLLSANAKLTTKIELKYLVGGTGWAPSYDLIAEDVNKPIELKYRAKVYNNTNVDWDNVKIKLSTTNPSLSAAKPQLAPWLLNFENEYTVNNYQNGVYQQQQVYNNVDNNNNDKGLVRGNRNEPATVTIDGKVTDISKTTKALPVVYEDIQVSDLSAEFDIKNAYTIPADAKPYIVEVTNYTLPASFEHYSIPKTEKEAFLLARIGGWEQLDLVEGPANVYFGGSYVGQSYIYTRSLDDTLDLSFGRDKKVMVSRTRTKEFNSKTFSGNNKKEMQSFEIVIKNNRKSPITIDVEDQLPVSQNSEIVVESIELSKAKKDDASGKLLWTYTIAPGEQQKIILSYSIKYPKNKYVKAKKFRTVSAPSF